MNTSKNPVLLIAAIGLATASFLSFPVSAQETGDPKAQIDAFYTLCKQGKSAEALEKALSNSETVKPEDSKRVAEAFAQMVAGMGSFIDYEITRETKITKRTVVLRCVAHFGNQPFVNEFTYYDPGSNGWRLIHLRYDANPATMFQRDLAEDAAK